jgi:hypothetical protein
MEDKTTEEEYRREKNSSKITFFDVVFFPFKLLGMIISFIFNFIKTGMRLISIILLIFFIWFGYNFYTTFSDLEEQGVERQEAAIEAFTSTFSKTKDKFSVVYNKIPSFSIPFLGSDYSDKENMREIFIETRGIPEAYLIMISYDEIKEEVPVEREDPLRFEVWFYGDPHNEKVSFENGFFKENKKVNATDELVENTISPLFFNANTTKNEIQSVFGAPTCVITEQAGEDTLTTYRFKETATTPLMAVTFVNEKIIAVSSGIIFLGDDEDSLCK